MRCDCTRQPLLQDEGTPLSPARKPCSLSGLGPESSPVFRLYLDKIKPAWAHAMESRLPAAPQPRWEPLLCVAGVATPVLTPPPRPSAGWRPTHLIRCPAAREEVPVVVAVQRDVQDAGVTVEGLLGPVPVVHVLEGRWGGRGWGLT